MRAVLTVEEDRHGRTTLVVTELSSQVNPLDLAEKIADLVKEGTVGGIADVRDEGSGRDERIVLVLKRDAVMKVVLNNLCQHTQLELGSAGNASC
jgi:DNA gyrase subunit A